MKSFFVYTVGFLTSLTFIPQKIKNLLTWPIATRILGLTYQQVVVLKDGFKMIGSMEDVLSRQILFLGPWRHQFWEPKTSKLLKELSNDSQHILVAGAHMGYDVLLAAQHTQGVVHAFEPIPSLYKRSKENIALNPLLASRITLTQGALGEKVGSINFFIGDIRSSAIPYSGSHTKERTVVVPVTTIDNYAKKRNVILDLIFLDIEGFEWFALNGAAITLSHKPKLILEISPRILKHTPVTPHMIFERLRTLGYETTYLDQDIDYANIYAKPII